MEKVSTLTCPGLTKKRRDGNTTKQVDFAIQKLFEGCEVIVRDHYNIPQADRHLMSRILDRIGAEHGTMVNFVEVELNKNTIKFKQ